MDFSKIKKLINLIRYDIIVSTTLVGSGHPTSSLSAVELMSVLFFCGFFKFYKNDLKNINNDKIILSKGHAAPLLYALYHVVGILTLDDIKSLRKFSSNLKGHLVPKLKFIDVATGSLGQGLSIALGMALGAKLKNINNSRYFALIGDSETAEGQFWEAIQLGSFYKLNNLIGIIDVNRLGQRGETMIGWDIKTYEKRVSSFGWKTYIIKDGHDINEIYEVFTNVLNYTKTKDAHPSMIIAKTIKGKGISFLEN